MGKTWAVICKFTVFIKNHDTLFVNELRVLMYKVNISFFKKTAAYKNKQKLWRKPNMIAVTNDKQHIFYLLLKTIALTLKSDNLARKLSVPRKRTHFMIIYIYSRHLFLSLPNKHREVMTAHGSNAIFCNAGVHLSETTTRGTNWKICHFKLSSCEADTFDQEAKNKLFSDSLWSCGISQAEKLTCLTL